MNKITTTRYAYERGNDRGQPYPVYDIVDHGVRGTGVMIAWTTNIAYARRIVDAMNHYNEGEPEFPTAA